jgi:hypothetical protein
MRHTTVKQADGYFEVKCSKNNESIYLAKQPQYCPFCGAKLKRESYFSPEPWKITGKSGNNGEAFVIENENRTIAWTADSPLNSESEGWGTITEEDEFNACLIAEAPELYKSCKDMLEFITFMAQKYPEEDLSIKNQMNLGLMWTLWHTTIYNIKNRTKIQ